jgi:peptidoglycan/xylan/chitin deacetylase (PgdA/CDA1 family)
MSILRPVCASLSVVLSFALAAFPQNRTVAITVDDLPYAAADASPSLLPRDNQQVRGVNRRLLSAFRAHHVPVTGFVVQKRVEELGKDAGTGILARWTGTGLDLGNHIYSHPDINYLSVVEIEDEILKGEAIITPLMKQASKTPQFFRFPMNHTGDTQDKHDQIAAFLSQRGYRLATCTVDNSDYLFNDAYLQMLARHDEASVKKLRSDYLAYTSAEIDFYAALNKQALGYEPPQVMLLHDNRLNADVIEQVLKIFEAKGYKFVTLGAAQSDRAYEVPDPFIAKYGKFGPMWGYRWAEERKVKVDGALEPDPPEWILQYGREKAAKTQL